MNGLSRPGVVLSSILGAHSALGRDLSEGGVAVSAAAAGVSVVAVARYATGVGLSALGDVARAIGDSLSLFGRRLRRRLPRTRPEGRLLCTVLVTRLGAQAQPRCPSGSAHPRDQAAVEGVGLWSASGPPLVPGDPGESGTPGGQR